MQFYIIQLAKFLKSAYLTTGTMATIANDEVAAHTCRYCQKFAIDLDPRAKNWIRQWNKTERSPPDRMLEDNVVVFDITLTEMIEGVESGCVFCQTILPNPQKAVPDDYIWYAPIQGCSSARDITQFHRFEMWAPRTGRAGIITKSGFAVCAYPGKKFRRSVGST
jgi:hypothetical protein